MHLKHARNEYYSTKFLAATTTAESRIGFARRGESFSHPSARAVLFQLLSAAGYKNTKRIEEEVSFPHKRNSV